MHAKHIRSLIEAGELDDLPSMSPKDDLVSDLDVAMLDIQNQANALYDRLVKGGHLDALLTKYPNLDEESIAIAVMRMTIERSGSLGAERVYKWFKRHATYL